MERKVGEVFTYNGKTYKVVPHSIFNCKGCAFKDSCFCSADPNIVGKCFKYLRNDRTRVIFKEMNNIEIKNNQLTIDIPEGMEIDLENSDLVNGIIKFKKKNITYDDIYNKLNDANIATNTYFGDTIKIRALVKLMNIAKYYNGDWVPNWSNPGEYKNYIMYDNSNNIYTVDYNWNYVRNSIYFKNKEDALAVINNPNFKVILDNIYRN